MILRVLGRGTLRILGVLMLLMLCGSTASATELVANLNCLFGGAVCPGLTSYGTVTLNDAVVAGEIQITVALNQPGMKFKDLMLNFDGVGFLYINSTDGQVLLQPNGFSSPPYGGFFDVGSTGQQAWDGDSGYTSMLSGNSALTLAMFQGKDSLGNLDVGIHLQNVLSLNGSSIKLGGLWEDGGGGGGGDPIVPEPATVALTGGALCGLALLARRLRRR